MEEFMSTRVHYELQGGIAAITMDDGKVNVLSPAMAAEINAALDRAEAERAVVLLSGRAGIFSAGFDLTGLRAGGSEAVAMLRAGFDLAARLLAFPMPVTIACTGHAVAMGSFLLLSGDYRIGADGPYRLTANEVAIGLTMPHTAVEMLRQRLTPAAFNRAVTLAEPFSPADAVAAGFLDRAVPAAELPATAHAIATQLTGLDMTAHAASKLRARAQTLSAIRTALVADFSELRAVA
jgi:enoyl-CoA hydratase/carnithine racemase